MTNPDETNGGFSEPQDDVAKAEKATSPHDGLFYATFSKPEHAAAEFRCIFEPRLSAAIDWDTLKPLPIRFVDSKLSSKYADVLFSVRIFGREVLIYVLFEHKSTSDKWTLLQLHEYKGRIWRTFLEQNKGATHLPMILPVVLHHSDEGWKSPKRFREYFDVPEELWELVGPYMVDFGIWLDDISHVRSEALLARPMPPEARFVLFCLRFGRTPSEFFALLASWSREFNALRRGPRSDVVVGAILMYVMTVGRLSEQEVRMRLQETFGEDAAEEIIFAYERRYDKGKREGLREGELKGLRKGLRKGKREGLGEGLRKTLQRQLVQRFGEVEPKVVQRIQSASTNELDAMLDRVLLAATVDEVIGSASATQS